MKKLYLILSAIAVIILGGFSIVSAAPVTQVYQGGTGTSTLPAAGNILIGNASGTGYIFIASSSFGGSGGGLATTTPFTAGFIPYATSSNSVTNSLIQQSSTQIIVNPNSSSSVTIDVSTSSPQFYFQVLDRLSNILLSIASDTITRASSTIVTNNSKTGSLTVSNVTNAIHVGDGSGNVNGFAGSSCGTQGVTAISATGTVTCSTFATSTSGGTGSGNLFVTPTSSVLANNEVVFSTNGSSTVRATSSIFSFTNGDNTFGSSTDNGLFSVVNASNTQALNISTTTNNTTTLNIQGFTMFSGSSTVTTPSIGGAIIGVGCDIATTTVDSSITSSTAVFLTTPIGDPGNVPAAYSFLLSLGLIETKVCSSATVTPNTVPYTVKIIK